jgi:phosphosulfolactate phosphohydrolase-like enzyme
MIAARLAGAPSQMLELSYGAASTAGKPRTMPAFGQLMVTSSDHAQVLKQAGFEQDVRFCARVDTSRAVPVVVECGDGWARLENRA